MEEDTKVISISKPSNPPGTDVVRTTATVCVRNIPCISILKIIKIQ